MIDLMKRFFSKSKNDISSGEAERTSHDIRIATCALLLEMANIDGKFSDSEKENIISILKNNYNLSDELANDLIKAADEELKNSIDLWQFTNLINQNYSIDEKIQIIETVWQIVYTDGKLDKYEDYLMHKLAKLLRLTHKQLIDAKLKVIHAR
ncbi:MAG: TerB family tellurite resistance protein [Deltaproteobacteria bacterium]|nr:MAG: TerB family tellurite resistance protein [Deltaproteobacteria bacterium]